MKINRYSKNTPLRRLGKKNVIASILFKYVPDDFDCLISLFFGTGSFEYNFIGKIKHLFANDLDDNIFNLYKILNNKPNELINEIEKLPIGLSSWNYYKEFKIMNLNDIQKATFFLYYSNFGYLGKNRTLRLGVNADKKILLTKINNFVKEISTNKKTAINYLNCDYKNVLKKISFEYNKKNLFIFADPPYLNAGNNYDTPKWTIENHIELQKYLIKSGMNFMICEFDNPEILDISKKNKLIITQINERRNIKNKRNEIIITNYQKKQEIQQFLF